MEHCTWCGLRIDEADSVEVLNSGSDAEEFFCSSDCLFYELLNRRTDDETYWKVMELLSIKPTTPR